MAIANLPYDIMAQALEVEMGYDDADIPDMIHWKTFEIVEYTHYSFFYEYSHDRAKYPAPERWERNSYMPVPLFDLLSPNEANRFRAAITETV